MSSSISRGLKSAAEALSSPCPRCKSSWPGRTLCPTSSSPPHMGASLAPGRCSRAAPEIAWDLRPSLPAPSHSPPPACESLPRSPPLSSSRPPSDCHVSTLSSLLHEKKSSLSPCSAKHFSPSCVGASACRSRSADVSQTPGGGSPGGGASIGAHCQIAWSTCWPATCALRAAARRRRLLLAMDEVSADIAAVT